MRWDGMFIECTYTYACAFISLLLSLSLSLPSLLFGANCKSLDVHAHVHMCIPLLLLLLLFAAPNARAFVLDTMHAHACACVSQLHVCTCTCRHGNACQLVPPTNELEHVTKKAAQTSNCCTGREPRDRAASDHNKRSSGRHTARQQRTSNHDHIKVLRPSAESHTCMLFILIRSLLLLYVCFACAFHPSTCSCVGDISS